MLLTSSGNHCDILRQRLLNACQSLLKCVDFCHVSASALPFTSGLPSGIAGQDRTSSCSSVYYGRPLSVSGRPCYILPMLFIYLFFYGRLILRPWLTEVRESFTRGGP